MLCVTADVLDVTNEGRCRVKGSAGVVALLLIVFSISGCTVKMGRLSTHSQFVYPNSNVKVLGPAYAEIEKTGIWLTPSFEFTDLKKAYNQALASQAGATLLINYSQDTSITIIPIPILPIITLRYELRGDAAKMVVGEQKLR